MDNSERTIDEISEKAKQADLLKFLEIKDLFRALAMENTPEREKVIRIWILWAFNDRVRDGGQELFIDDDEMDLWKQNCKTLLGMLDNCSFSDKMMRAELYRNLGEFEKCIEEISSIDVSDVNPIQEQKMKDQMKNMAEKKNSCVFQFLI